MCVCVCGRTRTTDCGRSEALPVPGNPPAGLRGPGGGSQPTEGGAHGGSRRTARAMQARGVPVARGAGFAHHADALAALEAQLGRPVVVVLAHLPEGLLMAEVVEVDARSVADAPLLRVRRGVRRMSTTAKVAARRGAAGARLLRLRARTELWRQARGAAAWAGPWNAPQDTLRTGSCGWSRCHSGGPRAQRGARRRRSPGYAAWSRRRSWPYTRSAPAPWSRARTCPDRPSRACPRS